MRVCLRLSLYILFMTDQENPKIVNSYFKVDKTIYLFDRLSKESVEAAWTQAMKDAEAACALTRVRNRECSPADFVSVWRKPIDSGPWSYISIIGEGAGLNVYLSSVN